MSTMDYNLGLSALLFCFSTHGKPGLTIERAFHTVDVVTIIISSMSRLNIIH